MPHVSLLVGSLAMTGFLSGLGDMAWGCRLSAVGFGGLRSSGPSGLRLLGCRCRCTMPCIGSGRSSGSIGRGFSTRSGGLLMYGPRRLSLLFFGLFGQERVALQCPALMNSTGCNHQHCD
jgi:hypothetical protein